jgi:hypothetical protein
VDETVHRPEPQRMSTLVERKRRGEETLKRYRRCTGTDPYACAIDAIADVLLAVSQSEGETTQILHAAEIDFRNTAEGEVFIGEG